MKVERIHACWRHGSRLSGCRVSPALLALCFACACLAVALPPARLTPSAAGQTYDTWRRIQDRGELAVSLDADNLPYSSARGDLPGFDAELAKVLAGELGVKLRINWFDVHRKTALGELLDGKGDLAFGAVVDPNAVLDDEEELQDKVVYSHPYYGTGYVLVVRRGGPRVARLTELTGERSRRLGTEAGSVADYALRQRGYERRLFGTQLAVLKALHDGEIDYAYLWANVGWTLHRSARFKVELVRGYVPEDRWNVAVAMRREDSTLKHHVDAALDKLVQRGTVAALLKRYDLPSFPPFRETKVAPQDHDTRAIVHPPTDRGLEPQMGRRETSVKRYGTLEKIRSLGEIVVALDEENLPFSALHPEPAGLDYEIARLLASELGVKLRVYWGHSSHSSYCSKLTTKQLCDVTLGVMPDDRFKARALFSKPCYRAGFQLVIPAGADGPTRLDQLGAEPLAIESGVAARGIKGRTVREYPSLEAVLDAVATGQAKAGYVSSTRGAWLAWQRWPGKLRFITRFEAVDCWPVCAAVRKTDGDLKEAIDQALDRLAASGRLAEVFARWHIPYAGPMVTGAKRR